MTDWQLLTCYVQKQDEHAFAELVERHVHLVYATARRLVGDHAEDVVQAVFMLLAQKGGSLRATGSLASWLYAATRLCCTNLRKIERHRVEREYAVAVPEGTTMDADSAEALACLDAALASLGAGAREPVLLRYFEQCSYAEMGAALGVTEEAARKRSVRGLEDLRRFFARHGFELAAAALVALAEKAMVARAPAGLAQTTVAVVHGQASAGLAGEIVEAVHRSWKRTRLAGAGMGAAAMIAGLLAIMWLWFGGVAGTEKARAGEVHAGGQTAPVAVADGAVQRGRGGVRGGGLSIGAVSSNPVAIPQSVTVVGGRLGGRSASAPAATSDSLVPIVIHGRLIDRSGRAVADTALNFFLHARQGVTQTDAQGQFTIAGEAPERVHLTLNAQVDRSGDQGAMVAYFNRAGKTDLLLKEDMRVANTLTLIGDLDRAGVVYRFEDIPDGGAAGIADTTAGPAFKSRNATLP